MTEPKWAEAVRARTERLIQDMHLVLPQNAGPVELEAALISLEQGYFGDIAQKVLDTVPQEKKD
jgi:hypothetical protein